MNYLIIILILLAVDILVLAVALRRSIKGTLYSYKNIIYLASLIGAIFLLVLLVVRFIRIGDALAVESEMLKIVIYDFPKLMSAVSIPISVIVFGMISVSNVELIRKEGFRTKNLLGFLLGIVYISSAVGIEIFMNRVGFERNIFTFIGNFVLFMLVYLEWVYFAFLIMNLVAIRHIPKYDKDYILILGCLISKSGGLLPLLKERTNKAIRYAWDQEIATGKPVHYVATGGQGKDEVMAEGSAISMYLLTHGAEEYEIFTEKESRNTYENFKLAKGIIEANVKDDYKIAFATTNYHVFRSGIYARMVGFDNPEGIASKTKWYFWPNGLLREFVAVLAIYKKIHIIATVVAVALSSLMWIR